VPPGCVEKELRAASNSAAWATAVRLSGLLPSRLPNASGARKTVALSPIFLKRLAPHPAQPCGARDGAKVRRSERRALECFHDEEAYDMNLPLTMRSAMKSVVMRLLDTKRLDALKNFEFRVRHRLGVPYEPEATFLRREASGRGWIPLGATVLDVGSNIGQYSALLSNIVGTRGSVHAFEPMPHVRAALIANLKALNCCNVVINPVGAAAEAGSFDLYTPVRMGRPSYQESSLQQQQLTDVVTTVRTVRLDDYALDSCAFAKFDIEGAELLALKGAQRLLSEKRPLLMLELESVFCRRFGYEVADLTSFLDQFGYQPARLVGSELQRPSDDFLQSSHGNIFFLPSRG